MKQIRTDIQNIQIVKFKPSTIQYQRSLQHIIIMSAKRPANQDIDQKTLEHKEKKQVSENNQNEDKNQPQRDIVTVKKEGEKEGEAKVDTQEQPKPATRNLFSGLFTNNGSTATSTANGSGLFSNKPSLFANNTGAGLFSKPSTGLFSNGGASSGQTKTGGLFSSTPSSGASIFNFQASGVPPIKNTGASLFASNQHHNDDDDSGDSAQLQAAQNLEADPSKSAHSYKYQQTCKLLIKQKAFKFKRIGGDLIQNVDIVVTQDNQSQLYYITVQLPATKKSIYTGLLLANKSQVKHLNNKKENVEVSAFKIVDKKPQQDILRCQFEKEEQGVQLHDTIDKIIKGTFVPEQQSEGQEKKETQKQKQGEKEKQTVQTEQSK